jgi:hypothetical protein
MKCKTDKSGRHKDGSGHHHPMGVFPVEEQLEQFGHYALPASFSTILVFSTLILPSTAFEMKP